MWWRGCNHVNVGICFECTAGEPGVGNDVCWMWLIVLLLLRTLFRLPPGPFSIHPLSVCTAAHKFYSPALEPTGSLNNCFIDEFPSHEEEQHTRLAWDVSRQTKLILFSLFLKFNSHMCVIVLQVEGPTLKMIGAPYLLPIFSALQICTRRRRGEIMLYCTSFAGSTLFHHAPCGEINVKL